MNRFFQSTHAPFPFFCFLCQPGEACRAQKDWTDLRQVLGSGLGGNRSNCLLSKSLGQTAVRVCVHVSQLLAVGEGAHSQFHHTLIIIIVSRRTHYRRPLSVSV